MEICAGLFKVTHFDCPQYAGPTGEKEVTSTHHRNSVHFSHFSVKEFLCSERLRRHQSLSKYSLEPKTANYHIGVCCLTYLIHWKDAREAVLQTWNKRVSPWVNYDPFSIAPLYNYAFGSFSNHCLAADEEGSIVPLTIQWLKEMCSNGYIDEGGDAWSSKEYTTPIIESSKRGMLKVSEKILEIDNFDVDLLGKTNSGTALVYAVKGRHANVVRFLLNNGADPNNQKWTGEPPIVTALKNSDTATVQALIDAGADPLVNDRFGRNALTYAEKSGDEDIVELFRRLLEKQAIASRTDHDPSIRKEGSSMRAGADGSRLKT